MHATDAVIVCVARTSSGFRGDNDPVTTLPDRPNTALLVVDVQNAVVDGTYERDSVVANISELVGRARREGIAVVWVRHHDDALVAGSDGWHIVPELVPQSGEPCGCLSPPCSAPVSTRSTC